MRQRFSILILLCTLVVCSIATRAQLTADAHSQKPAVLKLKIILTKETYDLGENVFTKTVFTNLSDMTLCFPKPDQERMDSVQGYLITTAIAPPGPPETEQFIDVIDGRAVWPREKLLKEIQKLWVKLLPNVDYTTESAQVKATFNKPGEWRLQQTYQPPVGSAGVREYLKSTALSVGCTLPDDPVSTGIVTITVAPSSDKK